MRKLGYLLLLTCLTLTACRDKSKFVIEGQFKNAEPQGKVYLYGVQQTNVSPLDSTVFSENGEFKFTHSTPGADFFRISSGNSEYLVIARNGDIIKITADLKDKDLDYHISGGEEADKLQELNTTKNAYLAKMMSIQEQFEKNVEAQPDKRDMIMEQMRPAYTAEVEGLNKSVLKFAQENSGSLAGFYAITMLNPAEYEKEMVAFADEIKGKFSDNPAVVEFVAKMDGLKKLQVGQTAPDFTAPGLEGEPVKLSDFKGKYVLLDFWASWCQPCRQENPNVVKAYQAYKDKNFTILSISLDKDPSAWRKAIADDHLDWHHAGELKDFEGAVVRQFQVEAIPSSFLLDPNGKILAKNLRGEELEDFLSKTL